MSESYKTPAARRAPPFKQVLLNQQTQGPFNLSTWPRLNPAIDVLSEYHQHLFSTERVPGLLNALICLQLSSHGKKKIQALNIDDST